MRYIDYEDDGEEEDAEDAEDAEGGIVYAEDVEDDTLFDQYGDFRDQEAFEAYVEGYCPPWALAGEYSLDSLTVINVDDEIIHSEPNADEEYLRDGCYQFDANFEAAASQIWHFKRLVGPVPVGGTEDFDVRSRFISHTDEFESAHETGHPETCNCPACCFTETKAYDDSWLKDDEWITNGDEGSDVGANPHAQQPAWAYEPVATQPKTTPSSAKGRRERGSGGEGSNPSSFAEFFEALVGRRSNHAERSPERLDLDEEGGDPENPWDDGADTEDDEEQWEDDEDWKAQDEDDSQFDQHGDFRDEQAFASYFEGYEPQWPDESDDDDHDSEEKDDDWWGGAEDENPGVFEEEDMEADDDSDSGPATFEGGPNPF